MPKKVTELLSRGDYFGRMKKGLLKSGERSLLNIFACLTGLTISLCIEWYSNEKNTKNNEL
jgi:hypothetical protein